MISVGVSVKNQNKHQCKRGYFCNPATCSCKNVKYAKGIADSVAVCDGIIEETTSTPTKTIPAKSTSKKSYSNKMYFKKFPQFTKLFINCNDITDSC